MNIDVTGIVITAFSLGLPAVIVVAIVIGRYLNHKKRYESIVKALELGKSPEQIKALFEVKPKKNGKNGIGFLRGGIIVISIGIGLAAMALISKVTHIYAPAALVTILGIALVIVYVLTGRKEKTQ
jgi:Flp pilus assembly protein TadB